MKKNCPCPIYALILTFFLFQITFLAAQSFNSFGLTGENLLNPTSLDFGPDGRLYVAQQNGTIYAFTVQRNGAIPGSGRYAVSASETINQVKTGIPNHNDDGSLNSLATRQITGLLAAGTPAVPILYVSSSDSRIGGGSSGNNTNLDTNSGVLSRLTWTGSGWLRVDLVRGLPRCEENHSTNGMAIFQKGGTTYLLLQQGGNANMGAPSNNFAGTSETFLSSALLIINITQLQGMTIYTDPRSGTPFVYDLPTLNDPERTNITNTHPSFPYPAGHPMRNATIDLGDPFGGNNGLNQAFPEPGGPVQIFSPGYRNAYDILVTTDGKIFTSDNGSNITWGGPPVIYTSNGTIKSNQSSYNPGAGDYVTNDFNETNTATIGDALHYLGTVNDANGTYYAGHSVPIRAFPSRAGVKNYKYNGSQWVLDSSHNFGTLLAGVSGYFNNSFSIGGFPDDTRQGEYLAGAVSSTKVNILDVVNSSTNGICEYTASNFSGAMQGDILTASYTSGGTINRYRRNTAGTGLIAKNNSFLTGFGSQSLDVIAQGDADPFPGTIWAATYGANNITIFEPTDFVNCIQPGQSGYNAALDYDSDGYTNGDEVANGTDHCSGGSKPADNDNDLVSDLNDPDDDNDGIPDVADVFALDPNNGATTNLPISYPFWNNDPGTGFFGLGFTGLMLNPAGTTNYLNQFNENNLAFGGAGGKATVETVTNGDALGSANNQDNGFQFGINVNNSSAPFTVHSKLENPFGSQEAGNGQSQGIYIGNGDQNNYLKAVVMNGGSSGDGIDGFNLLLENGGSSTNTIYNVTGLTGANSVDLYFKVNPAANTAQFLYSLNGGSTIIPLGSPAVLPASFLASNDIKGMAVGLIATRGGGNGFTATWDFINVAYDTPGFQLRLNAGGPQITHNGSLYAADQYFVGGKVFTNSNAQVPELYKTERSASPPAFSYNIPLSSGQYTVVLHFAEIYWGATGGGAGGIGKRIFDVSIENSLVLDNYDIYADVGPQTVVTKSFNTTVNDGNLNINFSAQPNVGGVDQPKVAAIEVYGQNAQYPPIVVAPIANQFNAVGGVPNFNVNASGGNPAANFTYTISGQPAGVQIEPTNGHIFGTIAAGAATGGPSGDGNHTVSVTASKPGSTAVTVGFTWTIGLGWADKNESENYTARHECSFVQAGSKFYLMGGRENAKTLDIYNYATNSWTALTNSAPVEFNHYQATEYQGLIWVIGAFKDNLFPNEAPEEYVWAFDPATQQWIKGPEIPSARRRGSSGLAVYNDKFYIVGGNTIGHNGGYVNWFDAYDPATGTWTTLANAPRARDHFHVAVIGNKLYAAGGRLSGGTGGTFKPVIPQVDVYDFNTKNWSTLPAVGNLPTPRAAAAVVNYNGKLLVIGGEVQNEIVYGVNTNDALKITESYDPATGKWTRLADLNHERHGTQGIVSGNGVFILAGSPALGGGNQKNMEYLGSDNPTGVASVSSTVTVPASVQIVHNSTANINLGISSGNVGVIIRSMQISGTNASDFSIVTGNLANSLLKPNSQHTIIVSYTGSLSGKTAVLTIDHGATAKSTVQLGGIAGGNSSGVVSLTMVNGDQDTDLFTLTNNQQISSAITQGKGLNIRANTNPAIVGSVAMSLSGPVNSIRTENVAPYALFGDNSGDYVGNPLPSGNYTISATAYGGVNKSGAALGTLTLQFSINDQGGTNQPPVAIATASPSTGQSPLQVTFTGSGSNDDVGVVGYFWDFKDGGNTSTVANPVYTFATAGTYDVELRVTDGGGLTNTAIITVIVNEPNPLGLASFTIVNATTDNDVLNLQNGTRIDPGTLQNQPHNIRANTNPATVGSVSFSLSGPLNRTWTENVAPYALFGDVGGDYNGVLFPLGTYLISGTAYSGSNRSGTALGTLTLQFSITSQNAGKGIGTDNESANGSFSDFANEKVREVSGSDIQLYPNPAFDHVYIVVNDPFAHLREVSIYDIGGRLVKKLNQSEITTIDNVYTIDIAGLESGIYMVNSIMDGDQIYTKKLVVRK